MHGASARVGECLNACSIIVIFVVIFVAWRGVYARARAFSRRRYENASVSILLIVAWRVRVVRIFNRTPTGFLYALLPLLRR